MRRLSHTSHPGHAADEPRGFEKPVGMRDYLPEAVRKLRLIEERVGRLFGLWGYDEVMTPTLEYDETVGGASSTLNHKQFKLLDKHGNTLVLRPDMTTPIARVVASVLRHEPLPLRLSYCAHIFRAQENEAGRSAEFKQMGVELIGDASPDGDAEMLALAIESLKVCSVEPFQLAIGHVGFLNAFLRHCIGDDKAIEQLKSYLNDYDYVGYREAVAQLSLGGDAKRRLNELLAWRGGKALLQERMAEAASVEEREALDHLRKVWEALDVYGVTPFVTLDLSMIGKMNYYTGIYFEGYAEDHGFPLLSGGRYDALLARFGRSAAAVGFQLKVDRVLDVSPLTEDQKEHVLIVYDPSERFEALRSARKWRQKGRRVTMQVGSELEKADVEKLSERYDEVICVEGGSGGDG